MSRTDKDLPYELGGQRHKYACTETGHARFTKDCRMVARAKAKAKADLRNGKEPALRYAVEKSYFD